MSEETSAVKKMDHIQLSAIAAFARSRKGGYVEEEVDVFIKNFVADVNKLVDSNNALRTTLAERDAKLAEVVAAPAALEQQSRTVMTVIEDDTPDRSAKLFSDAQQAARNYLSQAREDADRIVTEAKAAAEAHRDALEVEVKALEVSRDQLAFEKNEIISRLEGVYLTQLEHLRSSKGESLGSLTPVAVNIRTLEEEVVATPSVDE